MVMFKRGSRPFWWSGGFLMVAALVVAVVGGPTGAHSVADAATPVSRCGDVAVRPWCDTALSPDARATRLLAAMTIDERIALLGGDPNSSPHTGAQLPNTRLGIPAVNYTDGPVGPRQGSATAMPAPIAVAAAFNPAVAQSEGAEIATEAKFKGNDAVFAPTVNIERNLQAGRSYEAYSEEPFLVGSTAVAWIKGAQATGVMADVKHFAVNNQEGQLGAAPFTGSIGSRFLINALVDERTLREVYLPHFEASVKQAGVATLMCSYNMVNSTYACENSHLLQQVLQRDWGYKGIVLSDYAAAHNTAANLTNGLDFEPLGLAVTDFSYHPQQIMAALAAGMASQSDVDTHVSRILRTMFAFGIFDRAAFINDDAQIDKTADNAAAERVEEQAITLLKNTNSTLPIGRQVKTIAVIGPYADQFVTGGGSGGITPFSVTTALAGIRARAGSGVTVTYNDGSNQTAAASAAKAADLAIVVVGDVASEGQDKSCISLNCSTDTENSASVLLLQGKNCATTTCPVNGLDEDGLITSVAAANPKTVVVLETGTAVLTPWRDKVAAVIEAWYPGQDGGTAIARVLFGDVNPSGHLPVTFPASADQLPTAGNPAAYPGLGVVETYSEKLQVGYRWYDAHQFTPAYPFGFGLSYTTFRYSNLSVVPGRAATQNVASVKMTVTNTGTTAGSATPQLYLSKPGTAALPQVVRQLEGYHSVSLAPGESTTVTFPLNDRSFASWDMTRPSTADTSGSWVIPVGCYAIAVGDSSRSLSLTTQLGQHTSCGRGTLTLNSPAPTLASLPLPDPSTHTAARGGRG